MAIELEQKPAPATPAKYENYVEQELAKVRGRIRTLDAGGFVLLFLIATLGYALILALVDRALDLPTAVRMGTFGVYVLVAGFLLFQVGRCFWRRVNPYYAARQLEQSLPDAKNSIINWLDLRDEKLPPAIRSALGVRAAKDLKQADPEKAVNSRLPLLLGAILLGLVLAMLVLFVMESGRIGELLSRAFAPFRDIQLGSQTAITMLQPDTGNVTVPINRAVHFRARIDGPVPPVGYKGAPRLLYRYNPAEAYDDKVGLVLEEDRDGTWVATMQPGNVRTGFWYKITAGDAATPEYQVGVQSSPDVTRYEITYRYRPYLKLAEGSAIFPKENEPHPRLIAPRGTEVTLTARTNRKVRDGRITLHLDGAQQDVQGKPVASDPEALRFEFVLEKAGTGSVRVLFTSKDAEDYASPSPYVLQVLDDRIPTAKLTTPGQDTELPANGTLSLEGYATDDVGLKTMTLRLKVLDGADKVLLAPKTYREGKTFKLIDDTYPQKLDYKDFVALDKVKTEKGVAFPLKKGMVVEYWLEASDNSDYPHKDGNVGRSQAFKVTIKEPDKDENKQAQDRKQAEKQAKEHNNQQDKNIDKQNKAKQEGNNPQANPPPPDPAEKDRLDKEKQKLDNDLRELNKANDNRKEEQKKQGEAKGGEPDKAETKPGNQNKENQPGAKGQKPKNEEQAGQQKNEGQNGKGENAGQARDGGKKEERNQADARGAENPPDAAVKGGAPKTDPGKQRNPSEAAAPKQEPKGKENAGQARDKGGKSEGQAGNAKEAGKEGGMGQEQRAENKPGGKQQTGAQAKSEKAGDGAGQPPPASAEKKGPPKDNVASAKSGGDPKTKQPDAGASKTGEQQEKTEGQVKGGPPKADEPKSMVKETKEPGGMGQPKPDVKNTAAKAGEPQGKPKHMDPKQGENAGHARGSGDPQKTGDPKLDKTLDDIAKLREQSRSEDQKARDDAAKALEKMAKGAEDPAAREAAKRALEESKGQGQAKGSPDPKGPGEGQAKAQSPKGKEGPPPAEARDNPKGAEPGQQNAKAKSGEDQKVDPQFIANAKKGGDDAGNFGPNGQGLPHVPKDFDPNAAFSKRGGEMNLDQLKKAPEKIREAAGWTKERWDAFLKAAEAYNRDLEKLRAQAAAHEGATTARGQGTKLNSQMPRMINPNDTNPNAAQIGQTLPPLEFRDIYRELTRPDAVPPKR